MRFPTLCVLIITMIHLHIRKVESAQCSDQNKGCIWDYPRTEANCKEHGKKCKWCPDQALLVKRCQTPDRSCLVTDPWILDQYNSNEADCIDAGGVYCDGDIEKCCICPEPINFICFKPGLRIDCPHFPSEQEVTKKECNKAGCVYCGSDAINFRKNKCWKMPEVECPDGSNCCKEKRCMKGYDPNKEECEGMGCHICTTNDNKKVCNYGEKICPNNGACCAENRCGSPTINKVDCELLGCHMCCDSTGVIMCNHGPDPNPGTCKLDSFDCAWDSISNLDSCKDIPQCLFCENLPPAWRCQTSDRSCLVDDPWILDGYLNEENCEQAGGVFCNGDYKEMCICKAPIPSICFDPKVPIPCPTMTTNKKECHEAGCVYCDHELAIAVRKDKCFRMPCDAECEEEKACCKERYCMPGYDPDETECKNMGCVICYTDDDKKLCNYPQLCDDGKVCCARRRCGKPGITKDDCDALGCHMCCDDNGEIMCNHGPDPNPGTCVNNALTRFDCIKGSSRNEVNCRTLAPQCMFCPGFPKKLRCQTTDRSCLAKDLWVLPQYTIQDCTNAGGVFCNGDYKEMCICDEPAYKFCFTTGTNNRCTGATEKDCHENSCLWCGDDSFPNRKNKCWDMPAEATCTSGNCCKKIRCMDRYDPDEAVCNQKGCEICDGDQGKLCVYPQSP